MKNFKLFEFRKTPMFELFLIKKKCWLEEIVGFSLGLQTQYQGNILKEYFIHFKNKKKESFKVVYFKNYHDYATSQYGHMGKKLLSWFECANVRYCKTKDGDYVITNV